MKQYEKNPLQNGPTEEADSPDGDPEEPERQLSRDVQVNLSGSDAG